MACRETPFSLIRGSACSETVKADCDRLRMFYSVVGLLGQDDVVISWDLEDRAIASEMFGMALRLQDHIERTFNLRYPAYSSCERPALYLPFVEQSVHNHEHTTIPCVSLDFMRLRLHYKP